MLFYTGSRYVGYSGTNSDLLLNSVAMLFVTQIDDLLYSAFTPASARGSSRSSLPSNLRSKQRTSTSSL